MTPGRMPIAKDLGALGIFALIVAVVGMLGGIATGMSLETWYPALVKPEWTPTGRTISFVWTVLYALMAVSAWLVWRRISASRAYVPLGLWGLQLALNLAWTYIFFGLRSPMAAFVEIVYLWVAIAAMMAAFFYYSKLAAILTIPYLAWVTFASALNFHIWQMNA